MTLIKKIIYKIDIETLGFNFDDKDMKINDICKIKIRTTKSQMVDSFRENRTVGGLILVDENTNETSVYGLIV